MRHRANFPVMNESSSSASLPSSSRRRRRRLGPRKMTPANISEACISPRNSSYCAYIIIALREFLLRSSSIFLREK